MDGPEGGDLAVQFADEIYPHAHRIFQEALEEDSDDENEEEELDESGTSLLRPSNGLDEEEENDEPSPKRRHV